jgi:hypothetical protein
MMRRAMQPFALSDDTQLSKGQHIVVPAWLINRSEAIYSNPNEFDAFRFSNMSQLTGEETKYQMANGGEGYTTFGLGRHAWLVTYIKRKIRMGMKSHTNSGSVAQVDSSQRCNRKLFLRILCIVTILHLMISTTEVKQAHD